MTISKLEKTRLLISSRVRILREQRRWTQKDLAGKLEVTQGRISQLERGKGSFTAEQFIEILTLFNTPASEFLPAKHNADHLIQNALAQAGARHLTEIDALPSERLQQIDVLIRETLIEASSPRQIAALAPILLEHAKRIDLVKIFARLGELGLAHRFGWLAEHTAEAIRCELNGPIPFSAKQKYRIVERSLEGLLRFGHSFLENRHLQPDTLGEILSEKGLRELEANASSIDRRWAVFTRITTEDFIEALRANR